MSEFMMTTNDEIMSLYIPFVYPYQMAETIKRDMTNVIEKDYELGKVSRIDLVMKLGGPMGHQFHYKAYIHFQYWNPNIIAGWWQNDLTSTPNVAKKLFYRDFNKYGVVKSYFWQVFRNTSKKHTTSGQRKQSLNLNETKNEPLNIYETPTKQMTNKDFSDLVNAPIKKEEKTESFGHYCEICDRLQFDDTEEVNEELEQNLDENEDTNQDNIMRIEKELKDTVFLCDVLIQNIQEKNENIEKLKNRIFKKYAMFKNRNIREKEYFEMKDLKFEFPVSNYVSKLKNEIKRLEPIIMNFQEQYEDLKEDERRYLKELKLTNNKLSWEDTYQYYP